MAILEFEYNLNKLSEYLPDFGECKVERKERHFSLGIGLTSRCNFSCPMCYYRWEETRGSNADMPLPLLKSILQPLPQLANICIGLEGEPFCHPQFFKALDICENKADNLIIVSNGSLITRKIAQSLANYPIGKLILSIDAPDEITYRYFRRGGSLKTFLKNASILVDILGETIQFHVVVFEENIHVISHLPKLCRKVGISTISLQQYRPTPYSLQKGINPALISDMKKGIENMARQAEINKINLLFDEHFGEKTIIKHIDELAKLYKIIKIERSVNSKCSSIYNFTSITSSGYLFPCCGDYTPAPIYEKSFDGIFNHKYLQFLRQLNLNNYPLPPCKTCLYY